MLQVIQVIQVIQVLQVLQDDQAGLRLAGYRGWQASCQQLSSAVGTLAQTVRSSTWKPSGGFSQLWEVEAASIDGWMSGGGWVAAAAGVGGTRFGKYLADATNRVRLSSTANYRGALSLASSDAMKITAIGICFVIESNKQMKNSIATR